MVDDTYLTVLLPCLAQRRRYLQEAVSSVVAQTSPRWRLLVLVDRRTPEPLLKQVRALRDKRISVQVCRPGFAAALNDGLRAAKSPFASILLSDDRLTPTAVERMLENCARSPGIDFFYSSRRTIDHEGAVLSADMPAAPRIKLTDFTESGCKVKHMLCFRRQMALELGGMDESLGEHGCDDFDFPWTMAQAGARFHPVPECLYEYRIHRRGPRLTTDTDIRRQVEIMRKIFAKHGAGPRQAAAFLHRALPGYLLDSYLNSPERDGSYRLAASRYRAWTAEEKEFYPGRPRDFFPHRAYFLAKPGPDAMLLAGRYDESARPEEGIEIVLDAQIDDIPEEFFADRDLNWHGQIFGLHCPVAFATLRIAHNQAWVMTYCSDIVQRISRRREWKGKIQSALQGWNAMLLNALMAFAQERGLENIYSIGAEAARRNTDPTRPPQPELFERVYDRTPSRLFAIEREGEWWKIPVELNASKILAGRHGFDLQERPRTVCICHDIEAGLGHEPGEVPQDTAAALREMLRIEREAGVQATYSIVGTMFSDLRELVEGEGHCVAFHSYDHSMKKRKTGPRYHDELRLCREIDYRIRGYRPPQSKFTPKFLDEDLAYYNFEWVASSASSLGIGLPTLRSGLVQIPIETDDFDLHRGTLDYSEWERNLLAKIERRDFLAFSLHDCYAEHWLPHYPALVARLKSCARLVTLDQVSVEILRAEAL